MDSGESSNKPPSRQSGEQPAVPVYTQIGGESAIRLFIEQFYQAIARDPKLSRFFRDRNLDSLKFQQAEFLAIILGGRPPLDYWDIITSEPPPDLTLEHTDLMIEYAESILLNMGVPAPSVKQFVRIVSPFVDAFVGGSSPARSGPPITEAYEPEEDIHGDEIEPLPSSHDEAEVVMTSEEPEVPAEQEEQAVEDFVEAADAETERFMKVSDEEAMNARRFRELIEENLRKTRAAEPNLTQSEGSEPAESEDLKAAIDLTRAEEEVAVGKEHDDLSIALEQILTNIEQLCAGDLGVEMGGATGHPLLERLESRLQDFISQVHDSMEQLGVLTGNLESQTDDLKRLLIETTESRLQKSSETVEEDFLSRAVEEAARAKQLFEETMLGAKASPARPSHAEGPSLDSILASVRQPLNALLSHNEEFHGLARFLHEVSSRTATLALNAALEAARAGAQGRCFAVIAGEMKELARDAESVSRQMAKSFKACRYYAHEALENSREGLAHSGQALAGNGIEADFLERRDRLRSLLDQLYLHLSDGVHRMRAKELQAKSSTMGATETSTLFAERLFKIGKEVQDLREIIERFVL